MLGSELIAVSTIQINGQNFIKSIIKNTDGSVEFVLSFSTKLVNNDANFSIECHWNLDKFESTGTYYNFQIWSNSVDDLYKIGKEVLYLLNTQRSIIEYKNSDPPEVFVKKGRYNNGNLELSIVNMNRSKEIVFDGGLRDTELQIFAHTIQLYSLMKIALSILH